ncbi:MAG: RNA polymerase sigma factor, partial [Planctomycetes bacterium]|nr:RNA polymerase sigma factor [Planctomycetota bacterium]
MKSLLSGTSGQSPFVDTLVQKAQAGSKRALNELLLEHQGWIFNITLKMCGNRQDAEDVTQDVLVILLTKLSSFKGSGNFRSWLYRIVTNQVLNMKKRRSHCRFLSIHSPSMTENENHAFDLPDPSTVPVGFPMELAEIRVHR